MNISSLFQKRHLKPAWSYTTRGVLWRILFSETNFIVGEDRDTEKKSVTFFCLNAANGDVLWNNAAFAEEWWIGIEGVVHDKLYLHGFKKPDMPEHGKIIAVDLGTGRELWRNNDYAFLFATTDRVFAFRDLFERRLYYELDAATGELLREFREAPTDLCEQKKGSHGRTDFLFPEPLNESNAEYPLLAPKIAKYCDLAALRGTLEVVQVHGIVIFSYHLLHHHDDASNGDVLENRLTILDEASGKLLYDDILNASTPAPVPDSFFGDATLLYYIRERNTIVALPIPGGAE